MDAATLRRDTLIAAVWSVSLQSRLIEFGRLRSAADAKMLPQPEPRAISEHLVVPSIGGSDVAGAEWPNVRGFEHFL